MRRCPTCEGRGILPERGDQDELCRAAFRWCQDNGYIEPATAIALWRAAERLAPDLVPGELQGKWAPGDMPSTDGS